MSRGNIVGEGFNEIIIKQIDVRQQVFGSPNRTKPELSYLNGRGTFIKLSSSINVGPTVDLTGLGVPFRGDKLAQEYILFGGTAANVGTELRSGLYNAYNIGDFTQGYRPMPGITSINTKYRNRGSVRESTINIKAFNKTQLNIIDMLYLRLGYTVLLEWGHTVYLDNNGNVQNLNNDATLAHSFTTGAFKDQVSVQQAINKNKLKYFGNYDAIYGKVSNFSWNYETDGSYTITITVLSLGDIIESLKINTIVKGPKGDEIKKTEEDKEEEQEEIDEAETDEEIITAYKNKDTISNLFYQSNKALMNDDITVTGEHTNTEVNLATGAIALTTLGIVGDVTSTYGTIKTMSEEHALQLGYQASGDFISLSERDTYSGDETKVYVRFGGFLEYLKKYGLIYNGAVSYFDIDNDENTNLIYTTPYVLSGDPRVCIVKADIAVQNIGVFEQFFQGEEDTYHIFNGLPFNFQHVISDVMVGKLMNVYFSVPWILKSMDEIRDDKGDVTMYELLTKFCEAINNSLGNVNKLSVSIDDEDNNRVYFLDEVKLSKRDDILTSILPEISTKLAEFQIYGYNSPPAGSSFVKNLGVKTEITNDIATMITVGAQANGGAKGVDGTAFAKWNEGLTDRIIPVKQDASGSSVVINTASANGSSSSSVTGTLWDIITNPLDSVEKAWDATVEAVSEAFTSASVAVDRALGGTEYEATVDEYESFLQNMEDQQFEDNIDYMPTVLKNFLELMQQLESEKTKTASSTVGFIPLNLNLDIVGLSGMKIMQKFSINQSFLPYNYPQTIEFLIKGLSHTVDSNGWITSIESLSVPKNVSTPALPDLTKSNDAFTSTSAGSNQGSSPAIATSSGAASKGAKLSVNNIPATIEGCPAKSNKGLLNEEIVSSKIANVYGKPSKPLYVKGKKSFIAKLEKAYDVLLKQGIKLEIGDSLRDYNFQKSAYIENEKARAAGKSKAYKAHPCNGFHVKGQAIDLAQTPSQLKDITSHGKIYKALYDAGLRRISTEWWHWSVGETQHDINQKFSATTSHGAVTSPGDISNYNKY